jgi:hypothetical protein
MLTNKVQALDTLQKLSIDNASFDDLVKMKKDHESKKTDLFPITCQHCHKPVKQVRSSVENPLQPSQNSDGDSIIFHASGL